MFFDSNCAGVTRELFLLISVGKIDVSSFPQREEPDPFVLLRL